MAHVFYEAIAVIMEPCQTIQIALLVSVTKAAGDHLTHKLCYADGSLWH